MAEFKELALPLTQDNMKMLFFFFSFTYYERLDHNVCKQLIKFRWANAFERLIFIECTLCAIRKITLRNGEK